jgi:uncharacterized delta-60 repeat protein
VRSKQKTKDSLMPNKSPEVKMMILALAVLIVAGTCLGQIYWKRTYGGAEFDEARAITPTPDGNFIVAGYHTDSFGSGWDDVYLIKIKPNGDTLWTKTYGGAGFDEARAIAPTPDGNFIVAGLTNSFGAGKNDVYLLKIKPDGDTMWTKTYGGTMNEDAYAIAPTPDGNFIVAGDSICPRGAYVYLLKITPDGDTIWAKTYGAAYVNAITPTPDGNFIVAGSASSFIAGTIGTYLLKITPDGDTLWTKTYGGTSNEEACAVTPAPDGNFIVAGYKGGDAYLLKIKPDGGMIWTKTYGGTGIDGATVVTPTLDGNFIVAGATNSFGAEGSDFYLLKIKPDGDTIWTRTYGGISNDEAWAITPTPDGNFIVGGYTQEYDVLLISIIDDRYAYKDVFFTFKIPVYDDSLKHAYAPFKVPSGMTVSMGGTISWTPKTDSVYMDHVEFLVSDDFGKKDTLTFNIFVNSKNHPVKAIDRLSRPGSPAWQNDISVKALSSKEVRFSLPNGISSLRVYDIRGQLLENLSVKGGRATWLPGHASGRYFAKAIIDIKEAVKPFVLVR